MGQIDEEDKPFLIVDKDTGRVYDIRNESHVNNITAKVTRITSDIVSIYLIWVFVKSV